MRNIPMNKSKEQDSIRACGISRRNFVGKISLATAGVFFKPGALMAGPFEPGDFHNIVPVNKKLDPTWVKSLFERGVPTVQTGADLKLIGMPIGGICSGQLYLGGDGKLWNWDIFNKGISTVENHYEKPLIPESPLEQGFSLKIGKKVIPLDKTGFSGISFRGEYPVGTVEYKDSAIPVQITLQAFSPFIPLNTDDSSLPASIMRFSVHNTSDAPMEAVLTGVLENGVCLNHRTSVPGIRRNRIVVGSGFTFLECLAEHSEPATLAGPDIIFEDWSKESYDGWTTEGSAFGKGPILKSAMLPIQATVVGGDTDRVVNSFATAPNNDDATGKLTSRPFTIARNFISFWIGGGSKPGLTCLNLLVDGKVARTATGKNNNRLERESFEVMDLKGKQATLEIVDAAAGPWGNVGIGRIVFCDTNAGLGKFGELPDHGTMGLALLGAPADSNTGEQSLALSEKLVGTLGRTLKLAPGASATVTFVLTWFFPNLTDIPSIPVQGRYYASKFDSALAVAKYISGNFDRLTNQTLLWRDTCYDSTLPYWFLDRTFLNTSILASSTCYRFKDGRFWAWEGVGCCPGTCGHVWHYAQSMGRQFPELERIVREHTDFGLALRPDGAIRFRGENNDFPAIDAQAGTILRALREHQMSADDAFLKRIWPGVKKTTKWLIAQDGNGDGILEGAQHNTLDADWYGPVAWLSGIYLASLHAAAVMADEMKDPAFAKQCRDIASEGRKQMVAKLFDGEYFSNIVSPQHLDSVNSGTGCEIDQVIGQSWAFQIGLPRVLPAKETCSALKALWRYNFTPDVGPYRTANKPGRWFAMAGEAGLLMCTFPRADWDYSKAKGQGQKEWSGMYFNECMNGFEHQVASHMIWEGMVMEGMAIERALHDRYHASKRNPWNEIECGDHYARSMASYGVFLAACGFEYNGPHSHIGFAPRLSPKNFKAPFTTAEGWGSFSQKISGKSHTVNLEVKWGRLRLRSISLATTSKTATATVQADCGAVPCTVAHEDDRAIITLHGDIILTSKISLQIELRTI